MQKPPDIFRAVFIFVCCPGLETQAGHTTPTKGYLKIGQDIFQAARRFAHIICKHTKQRYG